ncbi:MAG: hypothetical protein COA78_07760 [Blastopirellula sp.]|nr:MAG: hypothetical protein COA78_07760 [Blastopirellula sp.]
MNPFRLNIFELFRNIIRTSLWLTLIINTFIVSFGLVWFTYNIVTFSCHWMRLAWFSDEWGV